MVGLAVAQINQNETAVGSDFSSDLFQTQGFLVESQGLIQILDIEIIVDKFEFHRVFLLRFL
jgi:hypothetical protein